jgi:DNA-binding response OmpR family regulator
MTEKPREVMIAAGLTKTEQAVFARLAVNEGSLVSRGELLAVLSGKASHTIDSHIMAIRRKLEKHGGSTTIETVMRSGFILRLQHYD